MVEATRWGALAALLAMTVACSGGGEDGVDGTDAANGDPNDALAAHPHPNNSLEIPPWTEGVEAIVEYTIDEFAGKGLRYYVPEQPLGMIFGFHGGSGSSANCFSLEWQETWNYMHQAGFGVVATDSDGFGWDEVTPLETNPDFQHLIAVRDHLMASTDWDDDTPIYGIGFSDGGGFNPSFADMALQSGWDMRAFGTHNSAGAHTPNVPAIRFINANDAKIDESWARQQHDDWLAAGIPAEFRYLEELTLDPMRFLKIPAYDEEDSQIAFDEMVTLGLVTPDGERIPPLGADLPPDSEELTAAEAIDYFQEEADETTRLSVVGMQMGVVWRLHNFAADYALDERDFFLQQL